MQEERSTPRKPARARVAWAAAIVAALVIAFLAVRATLADPKTIFIADEGGAHWIRARERLTVASRPASAMRTQFRVRFDVSQTPSSAPLVVRALRDVAIALDGKTLRPHSNALGKWQEPIVVDLAPHLKPGRHELSFTVVNQSAHAVLLAHCAELVLASGDSWEANPEGRKWDRALPVDEYWPAKISRDAPPAPELVPKAAPFLVTVFVLAVAWTIMRARGALASFALTPSRIRWLLLAMWIVLGANNLTKLPALVGFDLSAHMDYVRYVAEKQSLPYANEGWQMFQSPLFYIVAAPFYGILRGIESIPIEQSLRLVPLCFGALQVEVAYRFMRTAFQEREDLQILGIWVAGLLPMNLYISQVVGNEPLAGVVTAWVLLRCARELASESSNGRMPRVAWLGVALGLAILSKATAVLLIPLVFLAVWWGRTARGSRWLEAAKPAGAAVAIGLLVGGWFYLRNQAKFGQAIIGGWDPLIGISWWQDPSYRMPEHFTRFGEALVYPVYSATRGVWDAFYSSLWLDGTLSGCIRLPPWNYPAMFSCAWLALPVTLAIFLGMVLPVSITRSVSADDGTRRLRAFSTMALILFMAALLFLYLKLPIFSTAKATYTLGLTPIYGFLAALGVRPLLKSVYARAIVNGVLVTFGACAYASYFVWSAPTEPWPG